MTSSTLRRGKDSKIVFMTAHTALVSREGRKLPSTIADAENAYNGDKKAKLVRHVDGLRVHYTFEVGTDTYELFTQRG